MKIKKGTYSASLKRGGFSAPVFFDYEEPVDEGYDYSWMSSIQTPMARWCVVPYERTNSSAVPVGVYADAIAGIEKVEIYSQPDAEDPRTGTWTLEGTVTSTTSKSIYGTTIDAYWLDWDASSASAGIHRFYAKVYARNHNGSDGIRTLRDGWLDPTSTANSDTWGELRGSTTNSGGASGVAYDDESVRIDGLRLTGLSDPFNGEYTHTVFVGNPATATIYYVAAGLARGSGTGTEEDPFANIKQAINEYRATNANENNLIVYLQEGTHYIEQGWTGGTSADRHWLTISGAPGTTRDNVIISGWYDNGTTNYSSSVGYYPVDTFAKIANLRLYIDETTFPNATTTQYLFELQTGSRCIWFDNVKFEQDFTVNGVGIQPRAGFVVNARACFLTECTFYNVTEVVTNTMAINIVGDGILGDASRGGFCFDHTYTRLDRDLLGEGVYGSHPDVIQIRSAFTEDKKKLLIDNLIFVDVVCNDQSPTQGLFIEGPPSGTSVVDSWRLGNTLFEGVIMGTSGEGTDGDLTAHGMNQPFRHVLYSGCSFRGPNTPGRGDWPTEDCVMRNCGWTTYTDGGVSYDRLDEWTALSDVVEWYPDDSRSLVAGYPEIGYMLRYDAPRYESGGGSIAGAFWLAGAPAFPWQAPGPNDEPSGSGFRYEGDFRGLPPEGLT